MDAANPLVAETPNGRRRHPTPSRPRAPPRRAATAAGERTAVALRQHLPARRQDRPVRRLFSQHRRDPRLDDHAAGRAPGRAATDRRAARGRGARRRGDIVSSVQTRSVGVSGPAGIGVGSGLSLLGVLTLLWGINWPMMKLAVSAMPVLTFRTICLLGA